MKENKNTTSQNSQNAPVSVFIGKLSDPMLTVERKKTKKCVT